MQCSRITRETFSPIFHVISRHKCAAYIFNPHVQERKGERKVRGEDIFLQPTHCNVEEQTRDNSVDIIFRCWSSPLLDLVLVHVRLIGSIVRTKFARGLIKKRDFCNSDAAAAATIIVAAAVEYQSEWMRFEDRRHEWFTLPMRFTTLL